MKAPNSSNYLFTPHINTKNYYCNVYLFSLIALKKPLIGINNQLVNSYTGKEVACGN